MIDSSKEVIVVVDSSKFKKNVMVLFVIFSKVFEIIIVGEISSEFVENFR